MSRAATGQRDADSIIYRRAKVISTFPASLDHASPPARAHAGRTRFLIPESLIQY